jgi:hypothetical protein
MSNSKTVVIAPPNFQTAIFHLEGTAPYVQHKFSSEQRRAMRAKQEQGSTAKKGKARAAKDFNEVYRQCMYLDPKGQHGMPAAAFRNAMISACRIVGFKMTHAKQCVFIEADTYDEDGTALVFIEGTPEPHESYARNQTGVIDIRLRPMWKTWRAKLSVRFDADMFTTSDVANLLSRAGLQVGIGEGRPDSRESAGMGWGTFKLLGEREVPANA